MERRLAVERDLAAMHFARAQALETELRLLEEGQGPAAAMQPRSRASAIAALPLRAGKAVPGHVGRALVVAGRSPEVRQAITTPLIIAGRLARASVREQGARARRGG